MASIDIKINLGQVDLDSLHTEEDIRAAAKKLVLTALKEICEAAAETMWKEMQKAFSGPGFKANNSASDKQKFIADAGRKYAREARRQGQEGAGGLHRRANPVPQERAGIMQNIVERISTCGQARGRQVSYI